MLKYISFLCSAFAFISCTSINGSKGTYYTNADNLGTSITWYANGHMQSYTNNSNLHSPVVRIYGHTVTNLATQAATMGIGGVNGAAIGTAGSTLNNIVTTPSR
jgi:hypothetical protein